MTTSKTIATLIGPTLVALAAAMLLNVGSMPVLVAEISREPALIMISGVLLFVAGLAIVRTHNRWAREWPALITVLGWLALLGGLARMFFPLQLANVVIEVGQSYAVLIPAAIVMLVVGLFLSYKGYVED